MKTKIKEYDYTIFLREAEEGGYIGEVPTLPGCLTQGETIEETIENMKDAINLYLETLIARKKPVPIEGDQVIMRIKGKVPHGAQASYSHS